MGKKREHLTVEQIKALVKEEIPYVVGDGTRCIQAQTRRMKELMRRHGHDVSQHVGVTPVSFSGGGGTVSGGSSSGTSRDGTDGTFHVGHKGFRGQRIA